MVFFLHLGLYKTFKLTSASFSFFTLLIFGLNIGLGQDGWICSFRPLANKNGSFNVRLNAEKNNVDINTFLNKGGIPKKFIIIKSEHDSQTIAVSILLDYSKKNFLFIPKNLYDSIPKLLNNDEHLFELLHALGHFKNEHIKLDSTTRFNEELTADKFAGFYMNKLGYPLASIKSQIKEYAMLSKEFKYPNLNQRRDALEKGWEMYNLEQSFFDSTKALQLYPKDTLKIDSLLKLSLRESKNNHILSANSFLLAYQHSNGENIEALYQSFEQFVLAKADHKIIECSNELFKVGIGFLDDEKYAKVYQNLAMAYYNLGLHTEALHFLDVAIGLDSKNIELLTIKSQIYTILADFNKSISFLKKAIKIGPASPDLFFKLANAYKNNNEPVKAITYYKRVLVMEADHINARINLAEVYINEAIDLRKTIRNTEIQNSNYNFNALLQTTKELWEKAENTLIEGLDLYPEHRYLNKRLNYVISNSKKPVLLKMK